MNNLSKILFFALVVQSFSAILDEALAELVGKCAFAIIRQDPRHIRDELTKDGRSHTEQEINHYVKNYMKRQFYTLCKICKDLEQIKDPKDYKYRTDQINEIIRETQMTKVEIYWGSQFLPKGLHLIQQLGFGVKKQDLMNQMDSELSQVDPDNLVKECKEFNQLFRGHGMQVPDHTNRTYVELCNRLRDHQIMPEDAFSWYLRHNKGENTANLAHNTSHQKGNPGTSSAAESDIRSSRAASSWEVPVNADDLNSRKNKFDELASALTGAGVPTKGDRYYEEYNQIRNEYICKPNEGDTWMSMAVAVLDDLKEEKFKERVKELGGSVPEKTYEHYHLFHMYLQQYIGTNVGEKGLEIGAKAWVHFQNVLASEIKELHELLNKKYGKPAIDALEQHPSHARFVRLWINEGMGLQEILEMLNLPQENFVAQIQDAEKPVEAPELYTPSTSTGDGRLIAEENAQDEHEDFVLL